MKAMGLYSAKGIIPAIGAPNWEEAGDPHLRTALHELITQCRENTDSFVWFGVFEPTKPEMDLIAEAFELPHLQVEDASNPEQRAKIELDESGHGLAIIKLLDYVDSTADVHTGQLAVFIGPWFVVTVRHGSIGQLDDIAHRIETSARLRAHGPLSVFYAILDAAVDRYLSVSDSLVEDVEEVESTVFAQKSIASNANRIYLLKRENVEIRRAIVPLLITAQDFSQGDRMYIPAELKPYFQDVGDHLLRVSDSVDTSDNLLMTMLVVSTSLQDLQQNRDVRKISAYVAIAAVPTMIAAIYGMNFEYMPELHESYGYPVVLAVMGIICGFLFRAFKKSSWL
ncbi:MAG: magnesium transporter CorA [Actinobacteria bacterium]|nr:MAG: magnesium transporter CorA [Actinomycetota bacterium]